MARNWFVNGETLVNVKGRSDSSIGSLSELGLADGPIVIRPNFRHRDITLDAWGSEVPAEVQFMLADVTVEMTLVHIDRDVLDTCILESMAGAPAIGQCRRAGALMGNNLARFAAGGATGNHYIGLNLSSPIGGKPWRFYFSYLTGPAMDHPVGTEKSLTRLTWRAIPYTTDPYGSGSGAQTSPIWDHVADN